MGRRGVRVAIANQDKSQEVSAGIASAVALGSYFGRQCICLWNSNRRAEIFFSMAPPVFSLATTFISAGFEDQHLRKKSNDVVKDKQFVELLGNPADIDGVESYLTYAQNQAVALDNFIASTTFSLFFGIIIAFMAWPARYILFAVPIALLVFFVSMQWSIWEVFTLSPKRFCTEYPLKSGLWRILPRLGEFLSWIWSKIARRDHHWLASSPRAHGYTYQQRFVRRQIRFNLLLMVSTFVGWLLQC
jgi:hypothetical protein